MDLDGLEYQISSISHALKHSYLTKAQIITLIDVKVGAVSQISADVSYLKKQYNLITDQNAKLLTDKEYDELFAMKSQVAYQFSNCNVK